MSSPFVGEIRIFAGNFAPRGFAFCNGQLLAISQNTALFSLLGTTYGGNGTTTFALPNLQDRFPMHWGTGSGLTPRTIGRTGGAASVVLQESQIPPHTHQLYATSSAATSTNPQILGSVQTMFATTSVPVYGPAQDLLALAESAFEFGGGNSPHENRQPFLALSFVIALQGIFPSRN